MTQVLMQKKTAYLVLSDGTVFTGSGFGAETLATGEVVFNTSLTGYQEILTDPSYQGQIVVMTYPHIGNTGVNALDVESRQVFASGLVVKECARRVSNYRSQMSLPDYLKAAHLPGIEGIDTRALVKHIRDHGAQPAVLAIGEYNRYDLIQKAKSLPTMNGQNLAQVVSCREPYSFDKRLEDFIVSQPLSHRKSAQTYKVIAYDFGIKTNILRLLVEHGCAVTVVPHDYPAEKILSDASVQGVFLSNGPGDPAACTQAIANVKMLIGKKPIFGICLGHQILALALGAKTFKLKFGHRGGNQPVQDVTTGKVEITAQNHGFAVDPDSLPADLDVTHWHLNDRTISGLSHKRLPAFSVQYHPEASPGPSDSRYLFERFLKMMA